MDTAPPTEITPHTPVPNKLWITGGVALVALLIVGVAFVLFRTPVNEVASSKDFPPGLEAQVFAAVDTKTQGIWDKQLTVERVHISGKAVEGRWYAKDAWHWIAWQEDSGSWKVLVSLDGFDCDELKAVPPQYSNFFSEAIHISECYSHASRTPRVFGEQFRTESKVFYCAYLSGTESNCALFASNLDGSERQWLGFSLEYYPETDLLSPDKKYLLIIEAPEAVVIDTSTLQKKSIATAQEGTAFGVLTAFPMFHPRGRWVDSNTVELSVYPENTQEGGYTYQDMDKGTVTVPEPTPLEKKIIKID